MQQLPPPTRDTAADFTAVAPPAMLTLLAREPVRRRNAQDRRKCLCGEQGRQKRVRGAERHHGGARRHDEVVEDYVTLRMCRAYSPRRHMPLLSVIASHPAPCVTQFYQVRNGRSPRFASSLNDACT